MSIDRSILKLRQRLQLETKTGYLGNGSGEVHDRRYPGRYYVRFAQAGGGYTAPVSITANPNANLPTTDGLPVDVGYDASGQMIIVRANVPGMTESGYNVLQLNPLDQQAEKLINQTQITTFYTARHADLNNKPFYAVVFPGFLYINTTVTYFTGAEINLASLQPSSGDHCFAVVFIKNDATLEAFASTAINVSDPLATVDIQEAIDASTSGSQPLWAFEITGDDTALTVDPAHQVDLRAFVGGGVLGSGGGTVKSVALSASPAGVFDVSGSPITSSGTLALSLDSQAANTVLAGPTSGGAATPGFRALVAGDIPDLTQYLILAGRSGGQTAYGGTGASETLNLNSTAHATKGKTTIGVNIVTVDEVNGRVGFGPARTSPGQMVEIEDARTDPSATYVALNVFATGTYTDNNANSPIAMQFTSRFSVASGKTLTAFVFGAIGAVRIDTAHAGSATGTLEGLVGRIQVNTSAAGTVTLAKALVGELHGVAASTTSITTLQLISGSFLGSSVSVGTLIGLALPNMTMGSVANYAIQTNAGLVVFNEGGDANSDVRIEGDTDANLVFTDASVDSVGIGTATPTAYLHVKAATTAAASLRLAAGTAPTSPNAGDVWNDSTQKALQAYLAGIKQSMSGVLFTQTASQTVANTVTETTLFTTGIGSVTLPANFFAIGKDIRIRAKGYFSTTGNPNITFKAKYGSTALVDSGAFTAGAGVANHLWFVDVVITCRTTGGTGTVFSQGMGKLFSAHTTVAEFDMETAAAVTIDTTASTAIDLTVTWGTADAGNTITCTNVSVEVLN